MRQFIFNIFVCLTVSLNSFSQQTNVHVISIDGAINPATADFIHETIEKANEANSECLIINFNTPGGLLKSTRVIVTDILTSPIPIVVYVSPSGSQAASAGVFITLAAHFAVMAPGTNIGAAHPVTLGEQKDSVMMEKATNDAAAFIRTISEKRNRNIKWAEDAVRKSLSITETEALKERVIDTIANNIGDLLQILHNREIETAAGKKILYTQNAAITTVEKSFQQKLLDILSDPNLAYILMMLGIYGLLFELYNPGSIFPGVVGFICLILAFYSLHTLPINYAGVALILFAIILFILEIKIVSYGLLTIGGIISLALGSIMLIQNESFFDFVTISWEVILIAVVLTTAFFMFAIGLGIKAQRSKPTTGVEGMIGETGEVMNDLRPDGLVRVHGEIWKATTLDGTLRKGTKIRVQEIENLKLKVHKI
ncbi:MAG: nodulation protein NfeD [Bacteroidota bacterium]|nr:nodulation protein NfeD [Bacteroidota bacterium]